MQVLCVHHFVYFAYLDLVLNNSYLLEVLLTIFRALVVREELQNLAVKGKSARF